MMTTGFRWDIISGGLAGYGPREVTHEYFTPWLGEVPLPPP